MTFEDYLKDMIRCMREEIESCEAGIVNLESAMMWYQEYQAEQREEAKPTEKPQEAPPAQEAPKTTPPAPVVAAPEPPAVEETGRIIGDRRRKEPWTPERKAEASRRAKEEWAARSGKQLPPPVEERPRADFKKAVIPASKPPTSEEPKDETLGRIKAHQGAAQSEPKPSWSDTTREKSDIVSRDECPLSIAGAVLFERGKYISHLDKEQKAVMAQLIMNFGGQTLRVEVKDGTRNLDRTISELRGVLALTEVKIETTHGGWELC